MASETTLDGFGRVVIPKPTREHFGLEPGSTLTVEEGKDGILLRPAAAAAPLRMKGRVLVFTGEVTGDADQVLSRVREERIQRLSGRRQRPRK